MASAQLSQVLLEDIFEHIVRKDATSRRWTVSLGTKKYRKGLLVVNVEETCADGKMAFVHFGRIDAVQIEGGLTGPMLACLNVSKDQCVVLLLNPELFDGESARLYFSSDVDGIIKGLRSASRRGDVKLQMDLICDFVDKRHQECDSAIDKAERVLRGMFPEKYNVTLAKRPRTKRKAAEASSSQVPVPDSQHQVLALPDPLASSGSGFLNDPGSLGTPSAGDSLHCGTEEEADDFIASLRGSRQESSEPVLLVNPPVPIASAPPPPPSRAKKPRLEKVPTQMESAEAMSVDARAKYQESLMDRFAVQFNTLTVDIDQLHKPVRDPSAALPPYQIRHIQSYFLAQLTQRMKIRGVNPLALPFVLLVDPRECDSREKFDFLKLDQYHFYVIGGNHSACAKADLALVHPNDKQFRRVTAWIFAGLSIQDARNLAWCTNIDSEFRSQMSTIQRVSYIHMRFVENNYVSNIEFKSECAMEINLKDWGVRKASEVLNLADNLFQLAFRRDPEWSYIKQIFEKWELCQIKGQKPEKVPKKNSKISLDAKAPFDDMKLTEWKIMQPIKDPEILLPVLKRVIDGELSLPEMGQEFLRHKIGLKVQKAFLASLNEDSWSACKAKYPEHCSDNFLQNFVPVFANWVSVNQSNIKLCCKSI